MQENNPYKKRDELIALAKQNFYAINKRSVADMVAWRKNIVCFTDVFAGSLSWANRTHLSQNWEEQIKWWQTY